MKRILSIALIFLLFTACKKSDDTPQQTSPTSPPPADTTTPTGTDTTHTGTDTTTNTGGGITTMKVDTVVKATPTALLITTRDMDSVVLDWGDLFSFYIRLESYTGNDIKVAFHPKSNPTVSNANPDYPLADQYLIYKDTPDKSVLASYTLKDTMYTHWELYNKQRDTLVYVILVHDKSFVGSPELIYRLAYRTSADSPATSDAVKEAVEKNAYGILNWNFF